MLGQVTITCNQNPEADLAGYRVYCGTDAVTLSFLQEFPLASLSNVAAPSMTITGFPVYGTLYFGVSAYDASNNDSGFSTPQPKAVAPKLRPMHWP